VGSQNLESDVVEKKKLNPYYRPLSAIQAFTAVRVTWSHDSHRAYRICLINLTIYLAYKVEMVIWRWSTRPG